MKNLLFIAVATGLFTVTSLSAIAQNNVNLEKVKQKTAPAIALKFIEAIEITPDIITEKVPANIVVESISEAEKESGINLVVGDIEKCSATQFKYALMMNKEVELLTNTSLYNFIDEWWGTRYRYGGSDKNGIDCSSFASKLMTEIYNHPMPRTAIEQYKLTGKISKENLIEGDLVFFNTRGNVSHVGIYLGDNYFVHSSVHLGVVISSLTEAYYSKKFIGGGRVIK